MAFPEVALQHFHSAPFHTSASHIHSTTENRLVLDERRVTLAQAKAMVRQDQQGRESQPSTISKCCRGWNPLCRKQASSGDGEETDNDKPEQDEGENRVFIEKIMAWYARKLVTPPVRNSVLFLCTVLFAVCLYSTSQLEQKFEASDYVAKDSYVRGYLSKCK